MENQVKVENQFSNQNQNLTIQPEASETKQINWTKTTLIILIGVIVLVGAFYAGTKFSSKKENQTQTNLPTRTTKPSIYTTPEISTPTSAISEKLKVIFSDEKGNIYKSDVNGSNKEILFSSYVRSENNNFSVLPNGKGLLLCKNNELFLSKNKTESLLFDNFSCKNVNFLGMKNTKKVLFVSPEKTVHIFDIDNKDDYKVTTTANIGGIFAWSEKKNEIYAFNPTMNAVTKIMVVDLKTGSLKTQYDLSTITILNNFLLNEDLMVVPELNDNLSVREISSGKILKSYQGLSLNHDVSARFLTPEKKLFAEVLRDIFYNGILFKGGDNILIDPLTGGVEKFTLLDTEPNSQMGTYSPDGLWFYYTKIVGKEVMDPSLPQQDVYEIWVASKDGTQRFKLIKRFGSGGVFVDWFFEK